MKQHVLKICRLSEWQTAVSAGEYAGSEADLGDGFIHLSTFAQVAETAAKHFRGQDDLIIVAFDAATLGLTLKWETSRGGALFPHYYGRLDPRLAVWTAPARLGDDGIPIIPELGSSEVDQKFVQ